MVNSVSSNAGVNFTLEGSTRHVVSTEQKSAIEQVLSKFDASSLTSEDAQEITNAFKELEIRPSKSLRETIESAGFDANEIRNLSQNTSKKVNETPAPKHISESNSDSGLDMFEELLSQLVDLSNQDNLSTAKSIEEFTSRFSNMTDEAQNGVKDLLTQFKEDNLKVGSPTMLANSINEIMSKDKSYNHIEVYA